MVPTRLTCCGEDICFDCGESDRVAKISNLTGRRKMIQCMLCNQLFHSEKDTPWIVNKRLIRSNGIIVDMSSVKKAQSARQARRSQRTEYDEDQSEEDEDEDHKDDGEKRTLFMSRSLSLRNASGMDAVLDVIKKPNCILEDLDFTGYNFNDDNVIPFLDALMNNTSLKTVNMSGSLRQVSSTIWTRFAAVLENPTSKLKSLNLCYSSINSMALSSFANAIVHNDTLVELLIYNSHDWNSNWREFPEVLCNKSSIMATFNSNHTLQKVTNSVTQPSSLAAYLQMNQGQNKFHVARQKIIQTHFTGNMDIDMQHFADLELEVLPHAISWAGGAGLSFFYSFVRNNPLFYETGGRDYTGSGGTGVNKRMKV